MLQRRRNGLSIVREIIGRTAWVNTFKFWRSPSVDQTIPNYTFWDSLRRGQADGYALGGLFARPMTEIVASYVLGHSVLLRLQKSLEDIPDERREYTDQLLARFMGILMYDLITFLPDLYGLGDQYIVINSDGTVSIPSPETVEPVYDETDYRVLTAVKITTKLPGYEITDEYRSDRRVLTIKWLKDQGDIKKGTAEEQVFPNLIGMIPVVHFANDRSANEIMGRPIYEALLRLFSRYDDLVEKGLDGAELMGNPVPVFVGSQDPDTTTDAYAPEEDEEFTDVDGNTVTRDLINWDSKTALVLGIGADFKFATPPAGFTGDVREMAKLLFLLQLDHTRIPEGMWGGAINYSSGMKEQMGPFFAFISGRRLMLEGRGWEEELNMLPRGGLLQLGHIYLATRALTDPKLVVAPVESVWTPLDEVESEARLHWTQFLREQGVIDKVETVAQSGLVEDPEAAVQAADDEAEQEPTMDQFGNELNAAIQALTTPGGAKPGGAAQPTKPEANEQPNKPAPTNG